MMKRLRGYTTIPNGCEEISGHVGSMGSFGWSCLSWWLLGESCGVLEVSGITWGGCLGFLGCFLRVFGAALALARRHYWGNHGLARDHAAAVEYYEQAHRAGRVEGTVALSQMHLKGEGVEKNLTTALRHYQDAAGRGSIEALNGLGYLHFHGDPVPENKTAALEYFMRSAALGSGWGTLHPTPCTLNLKP